MRQIALVIIIATLTIISACVPSLQPLYTDDVLTFEPALIGTWVSADSNDTCVISQAGDSVYDLVYSQQGVPAKFEGHLAKLGDNLFLDTYPEDLEMKNDYYKAHIVLTHMISKITLNGDSLLLAVLDDQWLGEQVDNDSVNIDFENVGSDILLTSTPQMLQEFIKANANNEDAFPDPATYYRKP